MSIRASGVVEGPGRPATRAADGLERVERYFHRASVIVDRHEALLDRLDIALGDGDHGSNMGIGLRTVLRSLEDAPPATRPADVGELLRFVGHGLVSSVGGASGPLYGTAFIEAGFFLADVQRLDTRTVAEAFEVGARALSRRGRCAVGDKTILDALDPAVRAVRAAADRGDPLPLALRRAAGAAATGMRATIPLVAKRGLALRLGERSRGHRDPGATSCFLLVVAMAQSDGPGGVRS